MKNLPALMQREWLQHRFAWALLMLVPLALALLPLGFGHIQFDDGMASRSVPQLAALLALISIVGTTAVIFLIVWITSLFITIGLARRDHADRSIEFWLSLPTGHAESLAAPMIVHLLLVPAAAMLAGLLGGCAVSLLLVTRYVGLADWFALPWGSLGGAALAFVLRLMAGLPLAVLWLLPLILLAMLANALLRRWGLPVLGVALGMGGVLLQYVFGQGVLGDILARLGRGAGLSLVGASGKALTIDENTDPLQALQALPGWAGQDFVAALRQAVDPTLLAALLVSAALFLALVAWRQRGASSGI